MLKPLLLSAFVASTMVGQPRQAPSDFAVRLEFGCAGVDVLDSSKGTYEREMSREARQVAKIAISDALKTRWVRSVHEARFFEVSDRPAVGVICEPSMRYTLTVSAEGKQHTVRWDDCFLEPTTDEHKRVQALVSELLTPVKAMRSVARLRPPDLICL
jgi:hypothetical protein